MFSRTIRWRWLAILLSCMLAIVSRGLSGEETTGAIHGQIFDPAGALIPGALIKITGPSRQKNHRADDEGAYKITNLPPGDYVLAVSSKGFAMASRSVKISAGIDRVYDVALKIAAQQQQMLIDDEPQVNTDPGSGAGSIVVRGKALDAFSDDPDELAAELRELAGPSAGPDGGQIYIDGFTGGQLPPKASIREIRVNQNPFSAQYDKLGYGRIEVFTKPGSSRWHGQLRVGGNDAALDARNPFVSQSPGFHSEDYSVDSEGRLGHRATVFFNLERTNTSDTSAVNAFILGPDFEEAAFNQAVANPIARTVVAPRFDFQLAPKNTLTARYQFTDRDEQNAGVGQLSLVSQSLHLHNVEHSLQLSDTQLVSANMVNETRFEYEHEGNQQAAQNAAPQVSVLGAFVGGGNNSGNTFLGQNYFELMNYTSLSRGKNFIRFGGRLRASREDSDSSQNFNGAFTFSSLSSYAVTEQGIQEGKSPAQIRVEGGGASQFSVTLGTPRVASNFADLGLYAEDDWRVRPNVTLSYGVRCETQSDIHDRFNAAPRIGIAWGLPGRKGQAPKTVLRAGFGIFYDRFTQDLVVNANRLNGVVQTQYVIPQPDFFPNVPPAQALAEQTYSTHYQIAQHLRAPYAMQTAVSAEQQLGKIGSLVVTYLNSRGLHQFISDNVNAPLPGTFNPDNPSSGTRPLGDVGNIYQYQSDALYKENQVITNFRLRPSAKIALFGFYALGFAKSNTAGPSSFPMDQYNLNSSFGRSADDVRHRMLLAGSVTLPFGFSVSPFLIVHSGSPFDISTGTDLNGDSIFNDRPAFATNSSRPSVVLTRFGAFDTAPQAGQVIIPPNYALSPAQITINGRVSKTFTFGAKEVADSSNPDAPSEHAIVAMIHGTAAASTGYALTFSVAARNVLNYVNVGLPVGTLGSPFFGQGSSLAGLPFSSPSSNRRFDLQVQFAF